MPEGVIKKKSNRFNNTLLWSCAGLILTTVIFSLGYLAGNVTNSALPAQEVVKGIINRSSQAALPSNIDFNQFWQVWEIIKTKYYGQPVDQEKMFYGALVGITTSLGDPYSMYLDPELTSKFQAEINGIFEGIGAEIGIKKDQLVIIAPLPDSPAEQMGLNSGDQIIAIDGQDTSLMSLDYAVSIIRGKADTQVILKIVKPNATEAVDITVTRAMITASSVTWEMQEEYGYIKITNFNSDTTVKFNSAIQALFNENCQGIILDLRNDPGGYLDQAINIASQFISSGVIVYEQFSDQSEKKYVASGEAQLEQLPTVVLINEGSASAAEIVAGALQDYQQAILVGKTTFGKGVVQDYRQFSDGSSLKLTVAKWLTPNRNSIDQQGIQPDYEVDFTTADYDQNQDPQLDKALELLKNHSLWTD